MGYLRNVHCPAKLDDVIMVAEDSGALEVIVQILMNLLGNEINGRQDILTLLDSLNGLE